MIDLNKLIGVADLLWISLDTLRYDVAQQAHLSGKTAVISRWLANSGWERRHTPGNFTFAAHQAFFAGFLPTPIPPGPHSRLFAARFPGSETTTNSTFVFEEATIAGALAKRGYRTICIGGVGFFNKLTQLGSVLPGYFQESYWNEQLGVTCPESTEHQVKLAIRLIEQSETSQRCFLFINVAALHQPNYFYVPNAVDDSPETQAAALAYVDQWLGVLFEFFSQRANTFCILCSDHGTAYGESGFHGHRLNHPVVGDVPYSQFMIPRNSFKVE
jgi:Sulfatase